MIFLTLFLSVFLYNTTTVTVPTEETAIQMPFDDQTGRETGEPTTPPGQPSQMRRLTGQAREENDEAFLHKVCISVSCAVASGVGVLLFVAPYLKTVPN